MFPIIKRYVTIGYNKLYVCFYNLFRGKKKEKSISAVRPEALNSFALGLSISNAEAQQLMNEGMSKQEILSKYMSVRKTSKQELTTVLLEYQKRLQSSGEYQVAGCANRDEIRMMLESIRIEHLFYDPILKLPPKC